MRKKAYDNIDGSSKRFITACSRLGYRSSGFSDFVADILDMHPNTARRMITKDEMPSEDVLADYFDHLKAHAIPDKNYPPSDAIAEWIRNELSPDPFAAKKSKKVNKKYIWTRCVIFFTKYCEKNHISTEIMGDFIEKSADRLQDVCIRHNLSSEREMKNNEDFKAMLDALLMAWVEGVKTSNVKASHVNRHISNNKYIN